LKRRSDPTLPLNTTVLSPQQSHFGIAFDHAIDHAAAGNSAHLRDAEGLEHLGAALVGFFDRRFKQAVMARLISSCSS
jgi:hypothetical protein